MDLDEIKNLIEIDGGKFIIVERGKPILAAMTFEDYKKILEKSIRQPADKNQKRAEDELNNGELPKELEEDPLKIEDLPI